MPYHNSRSVPRASLRNQIKDLEALNDDLLQRYLVATMVAACKLGEVSQATAARTCNMTEDNFARAILMIKEEARRMLHNKEQLQADCPHPQEAVKEGVCRVCGFQLGPLPFNPTKHRRLVIGEMIIDGDELYAEGRWGPSMARELLTNTHLPHRRKL